MRLWRLKIIIWLCILRVSLRVKTGVLHMLNHKNPKKGEVSHSCWVSKDSERNWSFKVKEVKGKFYPVTKEDANELYKAFKQESSELVASKLVHGFYREEMVKRLNFINFLFAVDTIGFFLIGWLFGKVF